jgi:hypothetical protein
MDSAFFHQFPEMVNGILSPREPSSPPNDANSHPLAMMRLPEMPDSVEKGGTAGSGDRHGRSVSFGGFSMPTHWVSEVMAGI